MYIHKVPSTPKDLMKAITDGLLEATKIEDIKLIKLGTTVATNALITGDIARTALITTKGFRDVLEIRRGTRDDIWDHYNDPHPPLVKRRDRYEVNERIDYAGNIVTPLNLDEVKNIVEIIKAKGINSIAVCLVNSYANNIHEKMIVDFITSNYPEIFATASYEVNPEIFEYERTNTTVMNACLKPIAYRFFKETRERLTKIGCKAEFLVVHNAGGVMTPERAIKEPVRMISSGPAGGALAALTLTKALGYKNGVGIDSGGTSTDVSVIREGSLMMRKEWAPLPGATVRVLSIDVSCIGAGGGSVAWLDEANVLHVGPKSMGAEPGPACYGKGGTEPTLTDAFLVTGMISKEMFLGGRMTLYPELAEKAIAKVAGKLGMKIDEVAEMIIKIAANNVSGRIRLSTIAKGYDPREFALISFGGSSPLLSYNIGKELEFQRLIIPRWPGAFSAFGALICDVRHDIARMFPRVITIEDENLEFLEKSFNELEEEMMSILKSEGFSEDQIALSREAEMRYFGQWRSLTMSIPRPLGKSSKPLLDNFHLSHNREYNYFDVTQKVETYLIRVIGFGLLEEITLPKMEKTKSSGLSSARKGFREVYYEGSRQRFSIYERAKLGIGDVVEGPAIIEQMDTTVFIPQGGAAVVDEYGNLQVEIGR